MKCWIIWFLILLLALSGCIADGPNGTTQDTLPANTTQQPTVPPVSLYVSSSTLEKKTNGAVKAYAVEGGGTTGIDTLDGDIVVFAYDGENTVLTRLSSQEGIVEASGQCNGMISPTDGTAGTADNKLAYIDGKENCIVILDGVFNEVHRVDMPEGVAGKPVLSDDLSTVFYYTGSEIRALDLSTGIPRLVCQLNLQELRIVGLLINDSVVHCHVTDMDGNRYSAFYDAQTGKLLGRDGDLVTIESWDTNYLVRRMDGVVEEVLLGDQDGKLSSLAVSDSSRLYILPGSNSAAGISYGEAGAVLTVYELSRGNALGSVTLQGVMSAAMVTEDPSGKFVWFVSEDPDTGKEILCRWEYAAAGSDQTTRISPRYTAENPDAAGLAECEKLAGEISEKYGVAILLGDDPVAPDDYSFAAEHQVSAYKQALQALDAAMGRFPEDFFRVAGRSSNNPKLQINLVRAIVPNRYDVPAADEGLQYWIKQEAYITLVVCDQIERNFYHELCHFLDTYVNAHTSAYDYWSFCNPEGFAYDESYTKYESHADSPYLKGEERVFIDAYSMTYAYEDRATVFEYAMKDGCGEYFESEALQNKLIIVCRAIRRAFGWRYDERTFPWEQYLKESLAYVKK